MKNMKTHLSIMMIIILVGVVGCSSNSQEATKTNNSKDVVSLTNEAKAKPYATTPEEVEARNPTIRVHKN